MVAQNITEYTFYSDQTPTKFDGPKGQTDLNLYKVYIILYTKISFNLIINKFWD